MNESAGRLAAQVAMNTTLSPSISGLVVTFTQRSFGLICSSVWKLSMVVMFVLFCLCFTTVAVDPLIQV